MGDTAPQATSEDDLRILRDKIREFAQCHQDIESMFKDFGAAYKQTGFVKGQAGPLEDLRESLYDAIPETDYTWDDIAQAITRVYAEPDIKRLFPPQPINVPAASPSLLPAATIKKKPVAPPPASPAPKEGATKQVAGEVDNPNWYEILRRQPPRLCPTTTAKKAKKQKFST